MKLSAEPGFKSRNIPGEPAVTFHATKLQFRQRALGTDLHDEVWLGAHLLGHAGTWLKHRAMGAVV